MAPPSCDDEGADRTLSPLLHFQPAPWPLGTAADDVPPAAEAGDEATTEEEQQPTAAGPAAEKLQQQEEEHAAARQQQLRFQNNPRSSIVTRTLECAGMRPTTRADFNVLWQKKFLNPFQMRQLAGPHVFVSE
jgi:hypothetical protein